jgi:hypothetical protein
MKRPSSRPRSAAESRDTCPRALAIRFPRAGRARPQSRPRTGFGADRNPSGRLGPGRLARLVGATLAALFAACSDDDGTGPDGGSLAGRALVVNSVAGTLSVVGRDADGRLVAQNDAVELGAGSTAVTLAVGEGAVAIPDAGTSRLLVLEESTLDQRCAAALPPGSSPNGAAIAGGKAYVSLLIAGAVARVDLGTCSVEVTMPVGPAPFDVEAVGSDVLVVVSNIDLVSGTFPPPRLGPSFVAFLDAATLAVEDTVETGGVNAQFAAVDRDGDLLVVNTGDFGGGNSSVAVLDPGGHRFVGAFPIGDSAVDVAVAPSNLAYVTSFSDGLYVFDADANRVVRGRDDPLSADSLGHHRGAAGVAVDRNGNVLSVYSGFCATPGSVFLFEPSGALVDSVAVGICPIGIQLETSARPD